MCKIKSYLNYRIGAGDRNRTDAISLEGWSSTIELHPRIDNYNTVIYKYQTKL